MNPRLPISLLWFALTAIVFAAQWFPLTGIVLMFMLAPFWSVLLVNLGFLGIAAEAVVGRVSRLWLIAPLAFYGGYAAAVMQSQAEVTAIDARVKAFNAGKRVAFDPARQALVLLEGGGDGSAASAQSLVRETTLPVAYQARRERTGAVYTAHRIGGEAVCAEIRANDALRQAGVFAFGYFGGRHRDTALCEYYTPERPRLPQVRVTTSGMRRGGTALTPHRLATIAIRVGNGRAVPLLFGDATPMRWLPMPVIGCFLNSGAARWVCDAAFLRGRARGLGAADASTDAATTVVASALGLSPAPSRTARRALPPPPDFSGIAAAETTKAITALDRMMADPRAALTYHDIAPLYAGPAPYRDRGDQLVAALARAIDGGDRSRERARLFADLLSALPQADFAAIGPGLLRMLAERPGVGVAELDAELPARLGDLGGAALPLLERWLAEAGARPRDEVAGPIIGLCRAGSVARGATPVIAALLARTRRTDEPHGPAYLALLRLGRADLADRDPDAASPYQRQTYARWRSTIGPRSPRTACAARPGWPRLAD